MGHDDMEREAHLAGPPAVEVGPMLELAERAQLIRGGLLNYTGMLISGIVGIAIVPTMLGHLGFEAYGLWVAVLAVVVLIGEVDLGLSTIVTREVAADPAYEKNETAQLVSSAAVGYLVLAVAGALLVASLGTAIDGGLKLSDSAREVAPFVFVMGGVLSLSGRALAFSIALLYGRRRFGSANAITAVVAVVGGIGSILVLFAGGGLRAVAAWQAGVTSLIAVAALAAVLRAQPTSRRRARPSWRTLRPQVRFGISSQILTLSVNLLWVVAPTLVAAMLGTRLVASYDVGRKFPFALSALNWRSSESFFPAASRESRVGNLQRRRGLLEAVTRWNLVLALPLSVVLFLLAPNLLSVWLDSVPPHATAVLRLLAAVVVADAFGLGAVHILWAAGRMRSLLGILSATTLAGLGIALILLWQIGIVGVAIALLSTTALRSTLVLGAASREHDFPLAHLLANAARGLTMPLIAGTVVTFALRELIHPAGWIGLISVGLAGIVAYLVAGSLGPGREEEREILNSMLHVPLLAVGIVSRRLRGFLRRIGPLRSTSYLLRELARMAGSRGRPNAAVFDYEFAEKVDPWDYRHPSEQKRHLTAARMLDALRADRRLGRTLEIGCAEGMFTELLLPRCEEVLAVDISPVALERARFRCARSTNLAFAQWDLLHAPELGPFDLVVAMDVLDYFIRPSDFSRAQSRILGLLDDGGHLLVSTKNQSEVFETAWWRRWIQRGRMINESLASLDGLSLVQSDSTTSHTLSLYVRARG